LWNPPGATGWASRRLRFRPICLTAAASILAMVPLSRDVLRGPMAFAIMGGLLVATVLTLILLPVLYVTIFGNEKPAAAEPAAGNA
jgi:multidrug efflux pump subunit AcrB